MSPLTNCIKNKDTKTNPIWLMRQAGRYLPEFREIRKKNTDFIKLCLNSDLASEITLQPIKRFGFDGAVIFSDILMLPYGLGQKVEFEKNFGPKLGELDLDNIKNVDEINFTEKVYRMENIWCTYSRSLLENKVIRKRAIHSKEITFGCFQRPEKINQNVIRTWSHILLRKKNSIIIFINKSFDSYEKKRIINSFKKYNVNLSKIFFKIPLNRLEYISFFNLIDINLDTFPYNGVTTTFESLWSGVPVICLQGFNFNSRCGESILKNANLNNFLSYSEKEYINKAIYYAENVEILQKYRKVIFSNILKSNLFNTKKFTCDFEQAILSVYNREVL